MLTTTFKLLRKNGACKDRYTVLRKSLRVADLRSFKGRKDNDPITLIEILDSNGLPDALWALQAVPEKQAAERDRLAQLFACWCVRQVWHLLTDGRSRTAVEVAERYAEGAATLDELKAAYAAAAAAYDSAASDAYTAYSGCADAAAYAAAAYDSAAVAAAAAAAAAYDSAASAADAAAAAAYDSAASAADAAQAAKFREMFGKDRNPRCDECRFSRPSDAADWLQQQQGK